ncbi:MAG: hypothetical protein K9L56_15395 [Clostridiales bacterium]|nr:hypothetical protein [Clostridiales bacterium]
MKDRPPIIAVDFDGTLTVDNKFPHIGTLNHEVAEYIKERKREDSAIIILWTTRQNEKLVEALNFLDKKDVPIDYYNENVPWLEFKTSRKIFADIYLDDRALNINGSIEKEKVKFSTEKELEEL